MPPSAERAPSLTSTQPEAGGRTSTQPEARGSGSAGGSVSVVVITRNRRDELLENLPRLLALPGPPPLFVLDNGSTDGTAEAIRAAHPNVHVEALEANLGAAARNIGVARADTPYVAFADDDSWWRDGALERGAGLLDRFPHLALIAARVELPSLGAPDPTCVAMARSPLGRPPGLPGPAVLGFIACGAIVRRQAFLAVGGFDPRFGVGGEEQLLAVDLAAAGWALAYVDEVVAVHRPASSRDRRTRRRHVIRNDLWLAWLRRRTGSALAATGRVLAQAGRDDVARAALVDALRGAPGILRSRRAVPPELEGQLRLLERHVTASAEVPCLP